MLLCAGAGVALCLLVLVAEVNGILALVAEVDYCPPGSPT